MAIAALPLQRFKKRYVRVILTAGVYTSGPVPPEGVLQIVSTGNLQ